MSIEMVRIPSETPNISNIDDFVGLRYAFGNQDGYILDKGNECSYTINGSIFKINSGRLVLQGIECDIDANGVEITVDNVSTKRYYSVYLQINLTLNETKIISTYDTTTYPIIDIGDNLTQSTTGTARLVLYNFESINGVISNVQKTIKQIQYLKNYKVDNAVNSDDSKKVNGLELKRDSNGILKIGDIVIPQKKLLLDATESPIWLGSEDKTTIFTDNKSLIGRTFEICLCERYVNRFNLLNSIKFKMFSSGESVVDEIYYAHNSNIGDDIGILIVNIESTSPKIMKMSLRKHRVNTAGITNFPQEVAIHKIYEIIE